MGREWLWGGIGMCVRVCACVCVRMCVHVYSRRNKFMGTLLRLRQDFTLTHNYLYFDKFQSHSLLLSSPISHSISIFLSLSLFLFLIFPTSSRSHTSLSFSYIDIISLSLSLIIIFPTCASFTLYVKNSLSLAKSLLIHPHQLLS